MTARSRPSRRTRLTGAAALVAAMLVLAGCAEDQPAAGTAADTSASASSTLIPESAAEAARRKAQQPATSEGQPSGQGGRSATPAPAPRAQIIAQAMLTPDNLPESAGGARWQVRSQGPSTEPGGLVPRWFSCQRASFGRFGPQQSWHRSFTAGDGNGTTSAHLLLRFGSTSRTMDAFDTVDRWLNTCRTGLGEDAPIVITGRRAVPGTNVGDGVGRTWTYGWQNRQTRERGQEIVGVGWLGTTLTVTVLTGTGADPGAEAGREMIRTALERLAKLPV